MSRYIDVDKYLDELDKQICSDCIDEDLHCCSCGVGSARAIAKDAPTADVVEVVRCGQCKHCTLTDEGEYNPEDIVCDYFMTDGMQENDYCSYGERKEQ